jgi:hypothetical protein
VHRAGDYRVVRAPVPCGAFETADGQYRYRMAPPAFLQILGSNLDWSVL